MSKNFKFGSVCIRFPFGNDTLPIPSLLVEENLSLIPSLLVGENISLIPSLLVGEG